MPDKPAGRLPSRSETTIRRAMVGIMLGLALASLDGTTVATALPTIVADLGGLDRLPWVVAAYMTASTVVLPLYGRWSDILGRRKMFVTAILVFVTGAALSGSAGTMTHLIMARTFQGAGAGGLMVLGQAIVGDMVPARNRARYFGYMGAVMAAGAIAGPLVGGALTQYASWRWIFLMPVPVGLSALAMTLRYIPRMRWRSDQNFDPAGALLLAFSITSLVLVLLWGGYVYSWTDPVIVGLLIVFTTNVTAFVALERRMGDGILPLRLLARKDVILASAVAFVSGITIFGLIVFTPLFLQVAVSATPTLSGLLLLPLMIGFMASSIGTGRLISHFGRYKVFPVVGSGLLTIGFWLLSTMTTAVSYWVVAVYLVVAGVGVGMVMQVIVLALQTSVPSIHLGVATSSAQFFRSVGGTVGIAVFGTLLNSRLVTEMANHPGLELSQLGFEPQRLIDQPDLVATLAPHVQVAVAESVAGAVTFVFLLSVPVSLAAFLTALALRENPLQDSDGEAPIGGEVVGHA